MPLQSMTAYGFGETTGLGQTVSCELRTLNSRFLEVNVRMPRHLLALEVDIINHVKAALRRGKVDVFLDVQKLGAGRDLPTLDLDAVRHYAQVARAAITAYSEGYGAPTALSSAPLNALDLLRLEGVLVSEGRRPRGEAAADQGRDLIFQALDKALAATRQARQKEGESLAAALVDLTRAVETERRAVAAKRDAVLEGLKRGMTKRLESLVQALQNAGVPASTPALSDERLAMEIAVLSDKADVDEELTRLATHVAEFERLLATEDVGRKLDFLCQEMHREVNTMSNKLIQPEIAQHTVEMKQLVERIRQQVQNIE